MKLKIYIKSLEWWFWFVTLIAMITGLSGIIEGYYAVILVSVIQFIYFTAKRGFSEFSTQVRFAYAIFVTIALFYPTTIFYWALFSGHHNGDII